MEDALSAALGGLEAQISELGSSSPQPEQLVQLRSACSAALAVAKSKGALGAVHQKLLWQSAAQLWNVSIDLSPGSSGDGSCDGEAAGAGGYRAAATLLQAACDLCTLLTPGALPPGDAVNLVRFHHRAGQALASLGEFEAAEAVLARGGEAAQCLGPLCFERHGRGPQHQDCAGLLFGLLLERLTVALRLDQQMLSSSLISQAQALAADARLPSSEGMTYRLQLIRVLQQEGERLAKARQPAAAAPLLSTAYECLSQLELDGGEGEESELGAVTAEAHSMGASVLALLAYCNVEAGEAEQAFSCLQVLRQLGEPQASAHFAASFLSLRILLQLGRVAEAETELINLVSHEEATPEGCLAGLQAALAAPGGVPLARSSLSLMLERFSEEPGIAVELVRAALQTATGRGAGSAEPGAAAAGETGKAATTRDQHQAAGAAEATAAAESLVLDLVADERLLECVCEEAGLRQELLGMLWNHAVAALHSGQAFDTALAFFSAALPLLEGGGNGMEVEEGQSDSSQAQSGRPLAVQCRRAQALCCLGARHFDRALEFLAAADELQPGSMPTAMLRLSVQLEAGNEAGASAAVSAIADCSAAEPDALRIACIQAVDAGARGAARQALLCLLDRCSHSGSEEAAQGSSGAVGSVLQAPGYEATVFQNLINLLVTEPANPQAAGGDGASADGGAAASAQAAAAAAHSGELARLFDQVVDRMRATGGPAAFFLQQEGRPTQLEWFAATAWNAGQQVAATGLKMEDAAVLLAVSGELYAALPSPTIPLLHKQKMAFLMAATAACQVYETQVVAELAAASAAGAELGIEPRNQASPGATNSSNSSSLALARSYLQQARRTAASIQAQQALLEGVHDGAGGQAGAGRDPQSDVYLLMMEFRLCWLSGDVSAQQEVLQRARALPAFGAQQFGTVADMARSGPPGGQHSPEVCRLAEAGRLQCLTQQTPLDCAAVGAVLRSLMGLTTTDADKLQLLREASGLLSAMPTGAYPQQELSWLVTTAWNRGSVLARFGRAADAEPFQRWAVEALRHLPKMAEQYKDEMKAALDRTCLALEGGVPTP